MRDREVMDTSDITAALSVRDGYSEKGWGDLPCLVWWANRPILLRGRYEPR